MDAACVLLLTQAATTTQTRGQATHVALICNDAKRRRNGILARIRKLDAENILSVLIDRGMPETSTPAELSSSLPLPQPATAASAGAASDPPRGAAAADDDVDLDGTEAAASVGSAEEPLALDLDDVASAQPPVERAEATKMPPPSPDAVADVLAHPEGPWLDPPVAVDDEVRCSHIVSRLVLSDTIIPQDIHTCVSTDHRHNRYILYRCNSAHVVCCPH